MSNATSNLVRVTVGKEGYIFDLPVKAAVHIYEGTLVSQLTSGGMLVPFSTASSEHAVGVAQHEQDNTAGADGAKRVRVESKRMFAFTNGAGGDAFADTDLIGLPVFATDDHTVAKTSSTGTRKPVGFFFGFEADGKVRVFVDPPLARIYAAMGILTDTPATADALRDNLVAAFAS
jgi:hypothetical protein